MNSKKFHYVYRITNTKINKHYYGVRTSNIEPLKDLGFKYFSRSLDPVFRRDQKDNPQDYKYTIVSELSSRKEAVELEIKLHAKFDVGVNESFYNNAKQTSTGFDNTGKKASDAVRLKLREAAAKIKHTKKYKEDKSKASKGRIHYHDPITKENRMFLPHEVILGFVKGRVFDSSRGKMAYHNPITKELKYFHPYEVPSGYVEGMHSEHFANRPKRNKITGKMAYHNPITKELKYFHPSEVPTGFVKGHLPNKIVTCPHCGIEGGGAAMKRWHFKNCKKKQTEF